MASWLMLVPTQVELQHLTPRCLELVERCGGAIEICGFGPIVAAARAANLIATHRPDQVVLCGIAGGIGSKLDIASACRFDQVACYGIGIGCGTDHRSAASVGWLQWNGAGEGGTLARSVADSIDLAQPADAPAGGKLLLTSCAAAIDECDLAPKLAAYPLAIAEDMEGFAVAVACQLAGVPLHIVRGISNRAGDRDHSQWKIGEAMLAAVAIVEEMIGV